MDYLNKTIKYGIYALAFFLPVQTRLILKAGELNGGYFEYGTQSLYLTDIILITLALISIILKLKSHFSISNFQFLISKQFSIKDFKINYQFFVFLIIIACLVSIFFAQDKFLASYIFARLLLGVGLFWILIKAEYDVFKLIYFFLAGAFLQACLGIWQFFAQSSFPSKWLGTAMHDPGDLGVSVVELADGERWLRAYGGLDHPNILGGVMAMSLLIAFLFSARKPSVKGQPTNNFQFSRLASVSDSESRRAIFNFQLRYLIFYSFLLAFFTALFFSFSRNAWIGFVAGWIVLFFMGIFNKIERRSFFKASIVLGVMALMLSCLYGDLVKTRITNSSRLENISIEERMDGYKVSKEAIKEHWLFGTGAGNYAFAAHEQIVDKPSYFYQPVHNSLALIGAESGIFGIIGFLGFFGTLFYSAIKKKNFYLFLFLPVFLMMFNDHWWWSLHFGVLFFWFLAGCFLRFSEREILG